MLGGSGGILEVKVENFLERTVIYNIIDLIFGRW